MRKYLNIFDQTLKKNRLKVIIKKVFRRFESKRIDRKVLTQLFKVIEYNPLICL